MDDKGKWIGNLSNTRCKPLTNLPRPQQWPCADLVCSHWGQLTSLKSKIKSSSICKYIIDEFVSLLFSTWVTRVRNPWSALYLKTFLTSLLFSCIRQTATGNDPLTPPELITKAVVFLVYSVNTSRSNLMAKGREEMTATITLYRYDVSTIQGAPWHDQGFNKESQL